MRASPGSHAIPNDLRFLDSYDAILANSEYTRGWIKQLWQRDAATCCIPPIAIGTACTRRRVASR